MFTRRENLLEVGDEVRRSQVLGFLLQHLAVANNGIERCAQLVAHAGEKVRFGFAGALQLCVERLELLGGLALVGVEAVQFPAHLVHASGQGAEFVPIRHVDSRAEVALRHLAEEPLRLLHRQDE